MNQLTTFANDTQGKTASFKNKKSMLENINLIGVKVKCNSEDGQLKSVLVHPPDFLNWTTETAINNVQRVNLPPSKDQVKKEHDLLLNTLDKHGVDIITVKPDKDLPEGVYQRDSVCVIGNISLIAKFKFEVRQRETIFAEGVHNPWKVNDIAEFGDLLVFPDAVLVGLGDRTNHFAVQTLRYEITNKEIIPVPLKTGTLHLDYATTIGGRGKMKTMVVCPELYNDMTRIGQIQKRLDIQNIITVPYDKHSEGWTNLFYINPETVISTTAAQQVNRQLKKIGFNVIDIPFDGILRGEGAPRCCTAPLLRED